MSEDTNSKNVVSVWILVVLIGGMSVPFWRWNSQPDPSSDPIEWVDKREANGAKSSLAGTNNRVTPTADVNNPYPSPADGNQLLQEFSAADPTMKLQDAVRASKDRPGISRQFQGEGIPLTDIQPWLPKSDRFDASPGQENQIVGSVNGPVRSGGAPVAIQGVASEFYNSEPFQWPDSSYRSSPENTLGNSPQSLAGEPKTIAPSSSSESSPGRTVSAIQSPSTDPPALLSSPLAIPSGEASSQSELTNGKPVVTVKPSSENGVSPSILQKSPRDSSTPRKPGTMIRQPSRTK